MNNTAKEYGAALFLLACEEDKKQEYGKALQAVKDLFDESPEYLTFLSSPSIPLGERLAAIEQAFAACLPEHVLSFLLLLCEKSRISHFLQAADEYSALLKASEHVSNANVTSAVELSEEEKQKLKSKLEKIYNGTVDIQYTVDNSLLGGLIVEVDGKIIDGSLRQRLRKVKEVMNI